MRLLDNVYYFDASKCKWVPSFIISVIRPKDSWSADFNKYIVAGYGPSLPSTKVLAEDVYIRLVDSGQIEGYTIKL